MYILSCFLPPRKNAKTPAKKNATEDMDFVEETIGVHFLGSACAFAALHGAQFPQVAGTPHIAGPLVPEDWRGMSGPDMCVVAPLGFHTPWNDHGWHG